jgi:nuclear pore complex protein Nup133
VYCIDTTDKNLKLPSSLALWTSTPEIISVLVPQYDVTLSVLGDFQATVAADADLLTWKSRQQTEAMEREDMRQGLEQTLASLAEILCKLCVERVTWSRTLANDEQEKVKAEEIWNQYLAKRGDWIKPLGIRCRITLTAVTFGRSDKALDIAETYRDYKTLVELCLQPQGDKFPAPTVHERLEYYLNQYGEDFAFTLYNFYIQHRNPPTNLTNPELYADLLQSFPHEKASLSKFLQSSKYEKLRWIHELSLGDYPSASHTLSLVSSHERRLRPKKLALSVEKLSLLATDTPHELDVVDIHLSALNAQLQFAEDVLFTVVENCIDNQARVEIALDTLYIARNLKRTHLRTRVVKRALEVLVEERVVDPESLVDLFSLKRRGQGPAAEVEFETYFWGLQVLRAADVLPVGGGLMIVT